MKKIIALLLVVVLALSCFAGCNKPAEEIDYGTIRVGVHSNFGGAAAMASAYYEKFWDNEHVKVEIVVTTGPQVASGLQSGSLDVGFLGNGVSWNYFTKDSAITMLMVDNLTDDDRLLAKASTGLKANSSVEEIYNGLKGKSVALDLTATPASFFKQIIDLVNEGKADADKLWFRDLTTEYPNVKGLSKANEIKVVNTTNANIPVAMASDKSADFCVAFSPSSTQLIKDGLVEVAKTSTHLADKITPSSWAVANTYKNANPEGLQAFMNGLIKGMDMRAKDPDKALKNCANYLKMEEGDLSYDIAYWPTAEDLAKWSKDGGNAYQFAEQIRGSHVGGANIPDATTAKSVKEAVDFSYVLKAVENMK